MSKKVARINSRLYFDLFERGGDRLIAVFSILKMSRCSDKYYSYTAKNNKFVGGYSLLRAKTNLSLHAIKTYVPTLVEMGLISILDNGDVYVLGGEKIKDLYSSRKLVPILIGKNMNSTSDNSLLVRLHSSQLQQQREIEKKQNQSVLLKQLSKPTNPKLYKKAVKLSKRLGGKEITIVDDVVLSNQGYAVLKRGVEDNKPMGCYWKRKLIKNGLIMSKRRFIKIKKMKYSEYLEYISYYPNSRAVFRNGFLCEEAIATLSVKDIIGEIEEMPKNLEILPSPVTKPLSYLSFDMIHFWENL